MFKNVTQITKNAFWSDTHPPHPRCIVKILLMFCYFDSTLTNANAPSAKEGQDAI